MSFDEAGRRLITGANDGSVRIWNFSNGQCLQELETGCAQEISSIVFVVEAQSKYVIAGGWDRKVLAWRDGEDETPTRIMVGHKEDILSLAYSPPNVLASSCYDGRMIVWNLDSGQSKFTIGEAGGAAAMSTLGGNAGGGHKGGGGGQKVCVDHQSASSVNAPAAKKSERHVPPIVPCVICRI